MSTTTSWSKLFEASAETRPALGDFSGAPIGTIPEARATMPRRTDATTAPNIRFSRASIGESLLEVDESKKREMMVLFQKLRSDNRKRAHQLEVGKCVRHTRLRI